MDIEKITKLIYESGQLKRLPRSGWFFAGIRNPESVADHSWRTSLIGLLLAKMENVDENKVLKMCLLHDLAETRIGDINRVNDRYIENKSEDVAFKDILGFDSGLLGIAEEYRKKESKEAVVAKDADLLEVFVQAKEYMDSGSSKSIADWMKNAKAALKTKSAKLLAEKLESTDSVSWWNGLKKLPKD